MILLTGTARQTTLTDGSTRVILDLGELPADKVGEIHKVNRRVVFVALSLDEFTEQEKGIIDEANEIQKEVENGGKSKWYE